MNLQGLIYILSTIPDLIWGAFIATVSSVVVMHYSNKASMNRMIKQLQHDSSVRDRERSMNLRKEIYLDAAEAITSMHNSLANMTKLEANNDELSASFNMSALVIAKVNVVGGNELVRNINAFSYKASEYFLELFYIRGKLLIIKNEIEQYQNIVNKLFNDQDQLLEIMKQLNLEGNTDDHKWGYINTTRDFNRNTIEEYTEKINECTIKLLEENKEFTELCYAKYFEISPLIPELVFAVRDELELSVDRDEYLINYNSNMKLVEKMIEDFSKTLHEQINEIKDKP